QGHVGGVDVEELAAEEGEAQPAACWAGEGGADGESEARERAANAALRCQPAARARRPDHVVEPLCHVNPGDGRLAALSGCNASVTRILRQGDGISPGLELALGLLGAGSFARLGEQTGRADPALRRRTGFGPRGA